MLKWENTLISYKCFRKYPEKAEVLYPVKAQVGSQVHVLLVKLAVGFHPVTNHQ